MLTEHAFGEFYARHARALWTYVYRATNDAADADDIVQESFVRLLQSDLQAADEEGLRRYVFRIAGNLVVDRWRKRRRYEPEITDPVRAGQPGTRDLDVARIFSELKSRDRMLLWLAYVEGDAHEEIAASLRVARSSVKVLLSRARARLRDLLVARGVVKESEK